MILFFASLVIWNNGLVSCTNGLAPLPRDSGATSVCHFRTDNARSHTAIYTLALRCLEHAGDICLPHGSGEGMMPISICT